MKRVILRRVKLPAGSFLLKLSSLLVVTLLAAEICAAAPKKTRVSNSSFPRFEALPLIRSQQNHLLVRAFINGKKRTRTFIT